MAMSETTSLLSRKDEFALACKLLSAHERANRGTIGKWDQFLLKSKKFDKAGDCREYAKVIREVIGGHCKNLCRQSDVNLVISLMKYRHDVIVV